ncbi:MAG: putative GTP pyrophosphokinase [Planctomycetota bacterium]|jgi:putative GTP pyrophosphokinase
MLIENKNFSNKEMYIQKREICTPYKQLCVIKEMRYGREKITKAGKKIITSKSIEERNAALELINDWRANHLHPLNVMKNGLIRILKKHRVKPILISQRLKRLTSIEYKLDLNESMGLGGMQDIGGYRAVVKDTKDLFK